MIARVFPYPFLSAFLFVLWLMLNQSLSIGHILLAVVLSIGGGRIVDALEPGKARIRAPLAILRLSRIVAADVVRSNIAVGRIIFKPGMHHRTSGFVCVPLELRHPHALATLACIITCTPGTLWVNFDTTRGILMIHVLDLVSEEIWIDLIKGRYERLLMEIFE